MCLGNGKEVEEEYYMLPKLNGLSTKEESRTYKLPNGVQIFSKSLYKVGSNARTAIYIHGGGSGGNHTIVERPSYWMINKGMFGKIILPDRRGAGLSSPITEKMNYEENAKDMKNLLDCMDINEKITAIGISYGGPIALTLAAIDSRVEEVILIASSPSLKPAKGIMSFLYKHNMLEPIVRSVYKRLVGKLESSYVNLDEIYDAKSIGELKKLFLNGIKHTTKDRFESLMLENASTCDLNNQGISKNLKLDIPVYRVIGTKDEVWEVDIGDLYRDQISNIKTAYIDGANHKDVFFRADEFYNTLYAYYVLD
jgi:pimeloyl-ACP methyl ester carboxylesterase